MSYSGFPLLDSRDKWVRQILKEQQTTNYELCGLYLPTPHNGDRLVFLKNSSPQPVTSFKVKGSELREALNGWYQNAEPDHFTSVIFWHTHPRGLIGPSREDMKLKVKGLFHIVITPKGKDDCIISNY